MSRIRVLRIIARMNVGGPALQVTGLLEGMDRERFEQRLVTGRVGEDEADYVGLRAPDLPIERLDVLGRRVRPDADLRALVALVQEMRRYRPHIVHTHTAKAGVLGRIAARVAGIPRTVHTFHGHLLHGYFSRPVTEAVVLTERWLARWTDRLLSVGEIVRDELLVAGIGRPEQYAVMPPGVSAPPAPSRTAARDQLGLADDSPVVAFVARLTSVKRPDRFLHVAREVQRTVPDAVFVVAGEGPLLAEMQREARDLGSAVRFLGWRSDVGTVLAAADVIALTSDNEGMPVSLIEAAMTGCPAVTTKVGSAAEVVVNDETGFVVPLDPPSIARAISRLLQDAALRRQFADAGRDRASELFSMDRLVSETEALYDSLLRLPSR